jgi:hypothetical protein
MRGYLDCAPGCAPDFRGKVDALGQNPSQSGPKCQGAGGGITTYVVRPHAPTVHQPLAWPESAVGWCWRTARRPEASRIHCAPNGLRAFLGVSGVFGASCRICLEYFRYGKHASVPLVGRHASLLAARHCWGEGAREGAPQYRSLQRHAPPRRWRSSARPRMLRHRQA